MSQQKGMGFKEFRQRFQTEEACEEYLFISAGQMALSARNAAEQAVTGCADAGNMSASTAIDKARSRRGLSCIVPIFR